MKTLLAATMSAMLLTMATSPNASAADEKAGALAAATKQAIAAKDAAALDKLVYWEGSSEEGKAFFKLLLQTALEIDVETVEVEPLPPGKTGPPTTLTVTHLLKITGKEGSGTTRQMFPVGEKDGKFFLAAAKDAPPGLPK